MVPRYASVSARADAYRTRRTGIPSSSSSPPLPSSLGATTRTVDPAAHQPARERGEERARDVAGPAGIVVGEEDDPHRSVPDVEFVEAGQGRGPSPGSPRASRR